VHKFWQFKRDEEKEHFTINRYYMKLFVFHLIFFYNLNAILTFSPNDGPEQQMVVFAPPAAATAGTTKRR